jgi:hypothetical protein
MDPLSFGLIITSSVVAGVFVTGVFYKKCTYEVQYADSPPLEGSWRDEEPVGHDRSNLAPFESERQSQLLLEFKKRCMEYEETAQR